MAAGNERPRFEIGLASANIGAPGHDADSLSSASGLLALLIGAFFVLFPHHALHTQRGSSDSHSSEELPTHRVYTGPCRCGTGSGEEEGGQELLEEGARPQSRSTGTRVNTRVVYPLVTAVIQNG